MYTSLKIVTRAINILFRKFINFVLSPLTLPILDEMDADNSSLIGAHGYCSQEMVNLLLTGHAVSNTFDGQIVLNENGISRPSDGDKKLGQNIF